MGSDETMLHSRSQFRERLLALAGKLDGAGVCLLVQPFQFYHPVQQGGTEKAAQMVRPLAPVQADTTQGPPFLLQQIQANAEFLGKVFATR